MMTGYAEDDRSDDTVILLHVHYVVYTLLWVRG